MPILLFSCAAQGIHKGLTPFSALVAFYRGPLNHLSAVRHGQCPMYPSCSEYARQAIEKHGEAVGWVMACDRLLRCGRDEMRLSRRIFINDEWKYYDSVERNDFWWDKGPDVDTSASRRYLQNKEIQHTTVGKEVPYVQRPTLTPCQDSAGP